jgi:phosphoribosylformylglycinamidine cyclo-ligase
MNEPITYKSSGVDIDAGMESLRRIKERVKASHNAAVLTGLGSFGSLFSLKEAFASCVDPVLVQSVDGVGTKLMVAGMAGVYGTVGYDIVNHCCNDILCQGARPLTFLDYIAVERLSPDMIEGLVTGMAEACARNGVALVGGETAELPGTYAPGEFDLVGLVTGVVDREKIITGADIAEGDVILGLPSSGLHTNGYTLARKVIFDRLKLTVDSTVDGIDGTVGGALLAPHRDYSRLLWPLLQYHPVKGLAHITGGGFRDNIPRVLPAGVDAVIERSAWNVPRLFTLIGEGGGVPEEDMFRTFNMGVGMVIVIAPDKAGPLVDALESAGETVYRLGLIEQGTGVTRLV